MTQTCTEPGPAVWRIVLVASSLTAPPADLADEVRPKKPMHQQVKALGDLPPVATVQRCTDMREPGAVRGHEVGAPPQTAKAGGIEQNWCRTRDRMT